jgi:2,4-dienoyl-CoA reductase-like NADH-dependent reductase (Old Yellow Enzyme family)/thioredoxin reductase
MEFKHIFTPVRFNKLTVPNRVVHVPTDITSADADGGSNERVMAYHEEIARGGCGLIIVGASSPDCKTGRPTVTCLSVDGDQYIPGLNRLAGAMQKHGAKCAVQIQHPGRQAAIPRKGQMACSDMVSFIRTGASKEVVYAGDTAHGKIAREMTIEEIYDMIEKFGEAAWRVKQAGFDAVELHAAHGYLIASFMSPYTNRRNDRFGGSYENRMRFILEILSRIRAKCGPNFPILVRYSGVEYVPGGNGVNDAVQIAKTLEAAGVDGLDISTGFFEIGSAIVDPMYFKEGWNTFTAEAVKKAVQIPVITSHSLRTPEYCDKIIAEGKTDCVGLSRQLIADPYWANKVKAGKVDEIRKCISCNFGCLEDSLVAKHELRCAVNPAIGDMRFLDIKKAASSLKVAIVGGGIAGMEAARIAATRGHRCTIFEKENELGGVLRTCCMVPTKPQLKWYMDWMREQMGRLNVEVKLNTAAAAQDLEAYDIVLCATGAKTKFPRIPGAEKAIDFEDILVCGMRSCKYWPKEGKRKAAKVGQKVLIYGNHYGAADTAEALALRGREVILVTEDSEFGRDLETIHKDMQLLRFNGSNSPCLMEEDPHPIKIPVRVILNTRIMEIREGKVLLMDKDFREETIQVDSVVIGHTESDTALFDELMEKGVKTAKIGDARVVKNVRNAMTDGAQAAIELDGDMFVNANGMLTYGLPQDVRELMGL